jgi:hypothetical protein
LLLALARSPLIPQIGMTIVCNLRFIRYIGTKASDVDYLCYAPNLAPKDRVARVGLFVCLLFA